MKLFSRELSILISLLILFSIPLFPQTSLPITTPIEWKGADTLSKFYHFGKFKQQNQIRNEENSPTPFAKGGNIQPKIPFRKGDESGILGEPISDPRVIFSTYFGGNGADCGYSVAYDSKENIYMVGYSGSTNLATTDSSYQKVKNGEHDAFIAKFTNKGKSLWITYLGGSKIDVAMDCIIDDSDNIIIVGRTESPDFPFTEGKFNAISDVFIAKFSSEGKMNWSKCFGGSDYESAQGMAKAENGNFVITGYTSSKDLPANAFQTSNSGNFDAFIAKFDTDGNRIWSAYLGGGNNDIGTGVAVDKTTGDIAICGYTYFGKNSQNIKFPVTADAFQKDTTGDRDAFIAVFHSYGWIKWSTLYGGKSIDMAFGVTISQDKRISFCGYTESTDFPISENSYQNKMSWVGSIFLARTDNLGKREYSTFFGGNHGEDSYSIDSDSENNIWITGYTMSTDFPTTNDAIFKNMTPRLEPEVFFCKFSSSGYPTWSSYYLSDSGNDFAYKIKSIESSKFIVTGETEGAFFPVTQNCFQKDNTNPGVYAGFLVMIDLLHTDIAENYANADGIIVFKNPYDNTLEIKSFSNEEIVEISFFDLLGNILLTLDNINDTKIQLPLNSSNYIESRLILVKIKTTKQTVIKKFIY